MLDTTARSGNSNGHRAPSADDVRAHLEHVIASSHLEASSRRRKLLRYVVEETLAGRGDKLKGYAIAIAVFDRDKAFESQSDPVVRLEARRLRRDLDSYYMGAGADDPVRIHIPKGSYVAHFESHDNGAQAAPGRADAGPSRPWLVSVALITLVLVAALVTYSLTRKQPTEPDAAQGGPVVVVQPLEPLGSSSNARYLAVGISEELIGNLMRFPGFRVYDLPVAGGNGQNRAPEKPGEDFGAAYVISGSVLDENDQVHLFVKVQDAATGQVLWTESFTEPLDPKTMIKAQLELAGKIAGEIGAPYGIVNADLGNRQPYPLVSNMQSYICVLRAYQYRRTFTLEEYKPVRECLEKAVERDPEYSESWAMLGWLHLDAGRYEFEGAGPIEEEYQKAFEAASRAIALEPDNILALKAMSSIEFYLGRYDESERMARRAVELNPYDPDTLAQLGWRLAARGNFGEGIPLLEKAIERTANPPGWYYHLIAIDLYLKGEYRRMREVADHFSKNGGGVSYTLLALACSSLGDRECTRGALENVSGSRPLARDPAAYLRRHGANDEITLALTTGLEKARQFVDQAGGGVE